MFERSQCFSAPFISLFSSIPSALYLCYLLLVLTRRLTCCHRTIMCLAESMAPKRKAPRIAVPELSPPPSQEATTDYETESSGASDMDIDSPSEFDSGRPLVSTAKGSRKRPGAKYKNAELVFPSGRVVKRLRDANFAKIIRKCECSLPAHGH